MTLYAHTPQSLKEIAAADAGITVKQLISPNRSQKFARPRMMLMAAMYRSGRFSYPQIAALFSGRDHTTAMHANRKIAELEVDDKNMAHLVAKYQSLCFLKFEFVKSRPFEFKTRRRGSMSLSQTEIYEMKYALAWLDEINSAPKETVRCMRVNPCGNRSHLQDLIYKHLTSRMNIGEIHAIVEKESPRSSYKIVYESMKRLDAGARFAKRE